MLYQLSFPKPASGFDLTQIKPRFWEHCNTVRKNKAKSAIKTSQKAEAHFFPQPCITPVFSDTSHFSWFTKNSQLFLPLNNYLSLASFFLSSGPQAATPLDCNFTSQPQASYETTGSLPREKWFLGTEEQKGLGKTVRLKKNKHAHLPEETREGSWFSYTGRLERQCGRDAAVECPLPLLPLSYTGTGKKQKVSAYNRRDAARCSLLFSFSN